MPMRQRFAAGHTTATKKVSHAEEVESFRAPYEEQAISGFSAHPASTPPHIQRTQDVLRLQRTLGNRAVTPMLTAGGGSGNKHVVQRVGSNDMKDIVLKSGEKVSPVILWKDLRKALEGEFHKPLSDAEFKAKVVKVTPEKAKNLLDDYYESVNKLGESIEGVVTESQMQMTQKALFSAWAGWDGSPQEQTWLWEKYIAESKAKAFSNPNEAAKYLNERGVQPVNMIAELMATEFAADASGEKKRLLISAMIGEEEESTKEFGRKGALGSKQALLPESKYLYHVTDEKFLQSIKEIGLQHTERRTGVAAPQGGGSYAKDMEKRRKEIGQWLMRHIELLIQAGFTKSEILGASDENKEVVVTYKLQGLYRDKAQLKIEEDNLFEAYKGSIAARRAAQMPAPQGDPAPVIDILRALPASHYLKRLAKVVKIRQYIPEGVITSRHIYATQDMTAIEDYQKSKNSPRLLRWSIAIGGPWETDQAEARGVITRNGVPAESIQVLNAGVQMTNAPQRDNDVNWIWLSTGVPVMAVAEATTPTITPPISDVAASVKLVKLANS